MVNPFVYSRPLPPEALIDREQETAQLLDLLRGGHSCRLSAPRRYGKTSLIHKLRSRADLEGLPTVYVNFYGILSVEEAVERLDRAYRQLRGPLARWVTGRLESLSLSVSTPVGSAAVSAGSAKSTERRLHELLDLPSALFTRSGARTLVCFDEFQEVLSTPTPLDGAIRSVIEGHAEQAAYLFAGSHAGLMRSLFDDRERPFYGQARAVALGPLKAEDIAEHIGNRFEAGGREVGAALAPLLTVAQGHPQRVMMLAHFLWARVARGKTADEITFSDALADVMEELAEAFDRTWRGMGDGDRRTLLAITASGGHPTQSAGLSAAAAPRTTVVEALRRLTDAGLVEPAGGGWRLVDPLFARWVAQGRADA